MWKDKNVWQKIRLIFLVIVVILMTILVMQNWESTEIKFFFWPLWAPLSLYLLGSFVVGLGIGWFGHMIVVHRNRKTTQAETPPMKPEVPDWEKS